MKLSNKDFVVLFPQWLIVTLIWFTMMGQNRSGIWFKAPSLAHDWAFHFGMINNFAYRSLFLTQHPLFLNQPFRYHFAFDWLAAVLVKSGASLPLAIITLGTIFSCLLVSALYLFYKKLFSSRLTATIASGLFLANGQGGFGLLWKILNPVSTRNISLQNLFPSGKLPANQLDWGNFFDHELTRQPAFLVGLFLLLSILLLLQYPRSKKQLFFIGLYIGIMPLIHLPSFLVVYQVVSWMAISNYPKWSRWLYVLLPPIVIGGPLILQFFQVNSSSLAFNPGWIVANSDESLLWFWLKSLGIMFPLIVWGFLTAPKKIRIYSIPFWFIFLVANTILLQPRAWDNRKYFLYWYIMAAGLAGNFLTQLFYKRQIVYKIIAINLLLIATASGALDIFRLVKPARIPFIWAKSADLELASVIRNQTPKNAVFLTAPTGSANPLANLMGRQIIMYTPGLGSSYGFNLWQEEAKLADIYQGKITDIIPADYIIIGHPEREFSPINQEFFNRNLNVVIKTGNSIIYQL